MKIARAETDRWEKKEREEAGLLDRESGRSELVLGWATIKDFAKSQVLERLLMYEKRIESSLYKAMNELQKLQRLRERQQAEAAKGESIMEACPSVEKRNAFAKQTQLAKQTDQMKKQSQFSLALMDVTSFTEKEYDNTSHPGLPENKPNDRPSAGNSKLEILSPER